VDDNAAGTESVRRTLREEQKATTRRRILKTAHSLFVEHGYAAVTIDDITSTVGCSRATFYLHFPNKMEVLAKIGAETVDQRAMTVYADLDRVLQTGEREAFVAWVRRALAWFSDNRTLLPAWDEASVLEPEFRRIARSAIGELPAAMPAYLASWGPEREDEARLRIELLVSQLERFFTRWAVQSSIQTPDDLAAEVLTDIWYPALLPPAAAEH